MTQTPCFVYEFRWNAENVSPHDIRQRLNGIAKKYVFQLEQGDTGYLHYQGRMSLIKKRRKNEALALFITPPNYFEPTISSEHKKSAFYQMKVDTRLDGPFRDDDEIKVETKQLKIFKGYTLRPYQKAILDECSQFDMRKINLVWDDIGNCGKSLLSELLEYNGLAEEVPPFRMMDDIFQWVCSRPIKKAYIVDMPRGMKKDRLGDFYSGIEVIKNGVAYDKRYNAKKKRFDRPRIFVFTNTLPNLDLMSKDRWEIWKIKEDYTYDIIQ